ncbi:putative reverse transcriptase domain-containing protein [Tanacetum coccineum]
MRLSMFRLREEVHMLSRDPLRDSYVVSSIVVPFIVIMPPKSAPLTQAAVWRMIKESVDAAIAAERARHANRSANLLFFRGTEGAVELRRWFKKTESVFGISECAEGKKVKFDAATLQGPALTWWNSKNNQKQGNARAMTTAPTEGKVSSGSLPVCKRCFTHHVGQCTIKCHKCGKVGHKARDCKEKSVPRVARLLSHLGLVMDCGYTRSYKESMSKEGQARGN